MSQGIGNLAVCCLNYPHRQYITYFTWDWEPSLFMVKCSLMAVCAAQWSVTASACLLTRSSHTRGMS